MNCGGCGNANPEGARFCNECAAPLASSCASCGSENPPGAKFCNGCAAPLGGKSSPPPVLDRNPADYTPKHLADKILQSKSALEGERKQVTVMFADVKGSMELAEQLDPEVWHRILDRFFTILADGVHRFEGTVNQYTGDGIMALFGAPIAHEDHAHRACFSALYLRDEIRRYANEVRSEYGVIFGARIGLNSGEVVVGRIGDDLRMDYTAQGHTVGLAQRMEALADSGRICVSEQCAGLVQGYFELSDMGPVTVKGVSEPVGLFELEDVGAFRTRLDRSRARGLSGFVGRSDEMAALESALEQALAGQGRIAGVVADAGIGKSRLCYEFVERCRARGLTVHEAHCPAHGKTIPMLPALELMRGYFGVSDSDSAQITREKIAGRLLLLDKDFDEVLPLVWDFMRVPDSERSVEDLDADTRQQKLFTFVRQLVHARSKREPGVMFIDDLHWVDPGSDEIIAQLADALRGTRTLLLVNFRPEYRAEWMQRPNYQQLPLAPLPRDAIRKLIADLLGPDPSVSLLPDAIESRTEGNPFFTEEVVQSLIESKQLEGSAGAYRLTVEAARIELPASVHSVLAARIDRLEEREKRVLQAASVIGKNFPQPLLREITDLDDAELADSLRALCEAEFIFERSLYPVVEFAFKHPLTHEVAYLTQLAERRRSVHAVVAKQLESIGESAAMLAYHWDAAEEPEPAIRWHKQAAAESGRIDSDDVLQRWQRIAEFLDRLPESSDTLAEKAAACAQLLLIESRRGVTRERARSLYDSACNFGTRSGEEAPLTKARISFALHLLYSGQPGSRPLILQAVDEAERIGDRELIVIALMVQRLVSVFSDPLSSMSLEKRVIEVCDGDLDVGLAMLGYSALLMFRVFRPHSLALAGDCEAGIAAAVVATEDHGPRHRMVRTLGRVFAMETNSLAGEHRAALALGTSAIAEALEMGAVGIIHVAVRRYLGAVQVRAGAFEDARLTLDQALETIHSRDSSRHLEADCLMWLALAHLGLGNTERTKTLLDEATETAEHQEMRLPLARIHIARGWLIAATRPEALEEANAALNTAHSLANELGCVVLLPEIELARAELFERRGELEAAREAKQRALQLFQQQGAKANAERLAEQLKTSV